jgi:hypothetical protein
MKVPWTREDPLPSDAELFAHIERLHGSAFSVTFTRNWLARPGSGWEVTYKKQFEDDDQSLWGSGGGRSLREALWNATKDLGVRQDEANVAAVIEKLTS